MEVPFDRPRHRSDVLEHPQYYELRERLIGFLESQARSEAAPPAPAQELAWWRHGLNALFGSARRERLPAAAPSPDASSAR